MNKHSQSNALLVELLIVVLFFMLSACVLMQMFAGASNLSRKAQAATDALMYAQSLADSIWASDDPEAMLREEGYVQEEGTWLMDHDALTLRATVDAVRSDGMRVGRVEALYQGDVILSLPCSRYIGLDGTYEGGAGQ